MAAPVARRTVPVSSFESLRMSRTISTTAARLSMVKTMTTAMVIRRRTADRG
jgi:hypothetical protein